MPCSFVKIYFCFSGPFPPVYTGKDCGIVFLLSRVAFVEFIRVHSTGRTHVSQYHTRSTISTDQPFSYIQHSLPDLDAFSIQDKLHLQKRLPLSRTAARTGHKISFFVRCHRSSPAVVHSTLDFYDARVVKLLFRRLRISNRTAYSKRVTRRRQAELQHSLKQ